MTTHSVGGGSHDTKVYLGNGNDTVVVHGRAEIFAGSGNDNITLNGNGSIHIGAGNDTITMHGRGTITETGAGGHDTINLGYGVDTIYEQGQATVWGAHVGGATISGGELAISHHVLPGDSGFTMTVASGDATLMGGVCTDKFVGGTGHVVMNGSASTHGDVFVGGSGSDTMTGSAHHNVFEVMNGGHHVITNFVAGKDQLMVEGHSMAYLETHHDIVSSGGNITITLDGGATSIELKGVSAISASDIVTHK